jgi:hypothetical protein
VEPEAVVQNDARDIRPFEIQTGQFGLFHLFTSVPDRLDRGIAFQNGGDILETSLEGECLTCKRIQIFSVRALGEYPFDRILLEPCGEEKVVRMTVENGKRRQIQSHQNRSSRIWRS